MVTLGVKRAGYLTCAQLLQRRQACSQGVQACTSCSLMRLWQRPLPPQSATLPPCVTCPIQRTPCCCLMICSWVAHHQASWSGHPKGMHASAACQGEGRFQQSPASRCSWAPGSRRDQRPETCPLRPARAHRAWQASRRWASMGMPQGAGPTDLPGTHTHRFARRALSSALPSLHSPIGKMARRVRCVQPVRNAQGAHTTTPPSPKLLLSGSCRSHMPLSHAAGRPASVAVLGRSLPTGQQGAGCAGRCACSSMQPAHPVQRHLLCPHRLISRPSWWASNTPAGLRLKLPLHSHSGSPKAGPKRTQPPHPRQA